MAIDWGRISHITKVDPAKSLPDDLGMLAGTDMVVVGGSDDVTAENTLATIERLAADTHNIPILQEPYRSDHVSRDGLSLIEGLAVPAVYNGDRRHFLSKHIELFTQLASTPGDLRGADLPFIGSFVESRGQDFVDSLVDNIVAEGYVIQNPDSRAAKVSGAPTPFRTEEVAGAALATETFYRFPVFYIEYSGMYGGTEDVRAAADHLEETILLYGGGIRTGEQTADILEAGADAVVVGDCFHDDPDRYARTIPS